MPHAADNPRRAARIVLRSFPCRRRRGAARLVITIRYDVGASYLRETVMC